MMQSVSSGMCGPCCSVVPIGSSTASTPASLHALDLLPGHPLDPVLAHGSPSLTVRARSGNRHGGA